MTNLKEIQGNSCVIPSTTRNFMFKSFEKLWNYKLPEVCSRIFFYFSYFDGLWRRTKLPPPPLLLFLLQPPVPCHLPYKQEDFIFFTHFTSFALVCPGPGHPDVHPNASQPLLRGPDFSLSPPPPPTPMWLLHRVPLAPVYHGKSQVCIQVAVCANHGTSNCKLHTTINNF